MARQAGMAKQQSRNTSEEVEGSVAVGEAVQGGHVELRAQTQHEADLHPDVQWKERVNTPSKRRAAQMAGEQVQQQTGVWGRGGLVQVAGRGVGAAAAKHHAVACQWLGLLLTTMQTMQMTVVWAACGVLQSRRGWRTWSPC